VLFEKGGAPALKEYLKQLYTYTEVTVDGESFLVFENGTVEYSNGTLLFSSGGKERLEDWLDEQEHY